MPATAEDPSPLPLGGTTPNALLLAVGESPVEAELPHGAGGADGLGVLGFLVRDGIEDVGVDPAAGCPLPPCRRLGVRGVAHLRYPLGKGGGCRGGTTHAGGATTGPVCPTHPKLSSLPGERTWRARPGR